jgi:uncharacterized membrane protein (DUF485 family)
MSSKDASDFTPESEAPTDIAPSGRTGRKPSHELTAQDDDDVVNWNAIAAEPEFKDLLSAKARFIIFATIFFIIYYFTLPVLVGWFPQVMDRKVIGKVNWRICSPFRSFWRGFSPFSTHASRCRLGSPSRRSHLAISKTAASLNCRSWLSGVQRRKHRPWPPFRCFSPTLTCHS